MRRRARPLGLGDIVYPHAYFSGRTASGRRSFYRTLLVGHVSGAWSARIHYGLHWRRGTQKSAGDFGTRAEALTAIEAAVAGPRRRRMQQSPDPHHPPFPAYGVLEAVAAGPVAVAVPLADPAALPCTIYRERGSERLVVVIDEPAPSPGGPRPLVAAGGGRDSGAALVALISSGLRLLGDEDPRAVAPAIYLIRSLPGRAPVVLEVPIDWTAQWQPQERRIVDGYDRPPRYLPPELLLEAIARGAA
jgi:hypothetical protein